jgi:glycosyltransferase involved in cell wall biosynthesis
VIGTFANRAATTDPRLLGGLTVSMLRGRSGVLRREFDKLMEWTGHEPTPDVINIPNSLLISMAAPVREAFSRPVCCTLQGEELFLNGLTEPYRSRAIALIRDQVPQVDRFVAVSDYCADFMSGFLAIPPDRISVVPLGINVTGYEPRPAPARADASEPFRIGYFARIAPEKGLHVLAEAYVRFRRSPGAPPARLEAAGYLSSAHQSYVAGVRQTLQDAGLGHEFTYHGELDRAAKLRFLRMLDVLSVPATYDEPKGLFLLEAMAAGVPVVQPRRGAFVEIVERSGGGVLVPPDDPEQLAATLLHLARDPAAREELAGRAHAGVRAQYTVAHSADRLLAVYETVAAAHASAA